MDICCGGWGEKTLINLKFCKLTVLAKVFEDTRAWYECRCDCGIICYTHLNALVTGKWQQCSNCYPSDEVLCGLRCNCGETINYIFHSLFSLDQFIKGQQAVCNKCANRLGKIRKMNCYNSWVSSGDRCNNPNNKGYYLYGGRGIKRCSRWDSLISFYDDMGERPKGMQLDRIDPDGDYCKENCRWVTPKENANNRRCSKKNRDKYMMVKIEILKEYLPENILNKMGIKT